MPAASLFVVALLTVVHIDRLSFEAYAQLCIGDSTYNSDLIRNAKVRSTAVFIEAKGNTKTLGVGIHCRCSSEAGKRAACADK